MGVGTDHGKLAPMLNRRRLLAGISGAALTTGLTLRAVRGEAAVALRLGEAAPSATLLTLDERRLSTGDLLGRVVILTFWATWCAPCREELPLLSAYAERHAADGLEVLGFSLDSPDKLAEVRARASALSFPVGLLCVRTPPATAGCGASRSISPSMPKVGSRTMAGATRRPPGRRNVSSASSRRC